MLQSQNEAGWVGSARIDAAEAWADPGVGDAQGHHFAQELSFPKKDLTSRRKTKFLHSLTVIRKGSMRTIGFQWSK